MKRSLLVSLLVLAFAFYGLASAANVAKDTKNTEFNREGTALPEAQKLAKPAAEIMIFAEDFESGGAGWKTDGGYDSNAGDTNIDLAPSYWAVTDQEASSGSYSLWHDDDYDVSRDFIFSPSFMIPAMAGADPVVSANLSFMYKIDTPGHTVPGTSNLADYYMIYVAEQDTVFYVTDSWASSGTKSYHCGYPEGKYPEANSWQYLTSPDVDLTSAAADVALSCNYYLETEDYYDVVRVSVSTDGFMTETVLAVIPASSGGWLPLNADLSAFVGQTIKVRFSFLADSGTADGNGLWVDDIVVADGTTQHFADDAEGEAKMMASGITVVDRMFYDYDRVEDGGAEWHDGTADLFNGSANLLLVDGVEPGKEYCLAIHFITDGLTDQGEPESIGFFVDDVAITGISGVPKDAGVAYTILSLPHTQGLKTRAAALIGNFGFEDQNSSIALWYSLGAASPMPVPPYVSLEAFDAEYKLFDVTLPAADTTTSLTAWTTMVGDMDASNDTSSTGDIDLDPAGTATFSNCDPDDIALYSSLTRRSIFEPLSFMPGVDKYTLDDVVIFFYNPGGADSAMVKIFTITDADPITPVTMLFEGYEGVPAGDYSAHMLPVEGAVDLMTPISVEVTWPNAAGTGGLLIDSEAIFDGDIGYFTTANGVPEDGWYGVGNAHHIYADVSYLGDTAVNDSPAVAPLSFKLFNNYPNPFNPMTSIKFAIPSAEFVSVKVFNVNGQEVATLVNGELTAGHHSFTWDASNVSSGVYLYQIIAGEYSATHKMLLTK